MVQRLIPVVTSDNNSAGAGLLALLDKVSFLEALALVCGLELLSKLIVANTAGIYDRALR